MFMAVVSLALGESAKKPTIEGAGDFLQSDPAPSLKDSFNLEPPLKETLPTFQPPALFPDAGGSQRGAGPPATIFLAPGIWSLAEHDPLWAYVYDPGSTIPKPAPPPEPLVSAAGALDESQLRAVLTEAGWPEHLHGEALRIIHCESRGRPDANNGIDKGLFQMNFSARATTRGSWFAYFGVDESLWADPVTNATVARWAYELSGWPKWSCAALVGLD